MALLGRELMRTKLAEMGRAMMGYGDWEMLPQHKRRWNTSVGSTILQKLGSTQSYEEMMKSQRL